MRKVTLKEAVEELANIIFAPKLIVTNNRKLNWYGIFRQKSRTHRLDCRNGD